MLIPIGYHNFLEGRFIVEVMATNSSRSKRLQRQAVERKMLINATCGRRAQSTIIMKSKHVVLSALQKETIKMRLADMIPRPAEVPLESFHQPRHLHLKESSTSNDRDRRREPERRSFSYTAYIPERRSGTDRRTGAHHKKLKRNEQVEPPPMRK